ncbi:hypothetical protein AB4Y87_15235 [Paenarthrobacter sp. RAF54_2]|uniref:hypothetical protein n=1 Tax=Paenarthrobacter sp. RAF54_2 TaxID=3233061 RepID=UPI003F9794BF
MKETAEFLVSTQQRANSGDIRSLSRRFTKGELVRVRKGVYMDKSRWMSLKPWERYSATIRAVALELPSAHFCYETAAVLWGMQVVGIPAHIHLANSSSSHAGSKRPTTQASGGTKSGSTGLERTKSYGIYRHAYQASPVHLNGLTVTDLNSTAADVMARLPFARAVVLADHAISPKRFGASAASVEDLHLAGESLASAAKRLWVSSVLDFADARSGSAGESLSRAQMHLLGFPAPELQAEFHDALGFVARTDFYWRELKIIGEVDGDAKYLNDEYLNGGTARETVLKEKKREDRLRAMGFHVVRWDWTTAIRPEKLLAKLEAAGLSRTRNPALRTIHRRARG